MNNLIITYDLDKPGQDYTDLIAEIKKLGSWEKVQLSVWHVHTGFTAQQVFEHLKTFIDSNDRLAVIEATNMFSYNSIADWSLIQKSWRGAA